MLIIVNSLNNKPIHIKRIYLIDLKEDIFHLLHRIFDIPPIYSGYEYLKELSRNISNGLDIDFVLIGTIDPKNSREVTTKIIANGNSFLDNFTYNLEGTPCDIVFTSQKICTYLDHVAEQFPDDDILDQMKIRSYSGSLLKNDKGEPIGIFVLLNKSPMQNKPNINAIMNFFCARVNSELIKTFQKEELKALNTELQNKNIQMRELQKINRTTTWEYHLKEKKLEASEDLLLLYEKPIKNHLSWRKILKPFHSSARSKIKKYIKECIYDGIPFSDTFEFTPINNKKNGFGLQAIK